MTALDGGRPVRLERLGEWDCGRSYGSGSRVDGDGEGRIRG